jgi:hypothetical protein
VNPEDLELEPSRVRLEDFTGFDLILERMRRGQKPRRRRPLWRGQHQQSVLMLQLLGQMWGDWSRCGLVPDTAAVSSD